MASEIGSWRGGEERILRRRPRDWEPRDPVEDGGIFTTKNEDFFPQKFQNPQKITG